MLSKEQAQKISKWANHQQTLMKYGQFLTSPLSKDEIKKISKRGESFVNNVIPSPCVVVLLPNKTENKFYCEFWMQVKGWYGEDKSYVYFSPTNTEEGKLFLSIAKKHLSSLKEEANYFNY